ncbi:Smad nuclear-interacting protein 1 [Rhodotorula diobovata]|uniref:Smad nuclear-interacting protein 1 n=1 Tax=Rhodotorula diobovata TaxID=5288 RepID=A0A5C5FYW9_9BASI|nr:Smad nuclear-interacting protein 1 [Rhodotorula diobovata]
MSDRYSRRSPSPGPSSSSRRDRSPPPRTRDSRRDYDDGDRRRGTGDRDRRPARDDDRRRAGGAGGGGGDRRSRSPGAVRRRSRSPPARGGGPSGGDGGWGKRDALPDQGALVPGGGGSGRSGEVGDRAPPKVVEPDFKPSGALAAETNTLNGVVLKYAEPPEARKPVRNWRLYVFKGKEQVELFHVHRQSCYLFGRDRIVADIPVDHPSASKQHAVLQFRQVTERNEFGDTKSLTKPFLIDLDSANGTMVNDEAVPASRFYELRSGDVLKFAFSSREYVLLVEQ